MIKLLSPKTSDKVYPFIHKAISTMTKNEKSWIVFKDIITKEYTSEEGL